MGRKRVKQPKKRVKIAIDADLLDELREDGVNISRLFSLLVRRYYIRKKRRK